ncbi:MAG: energy transducer TonB [Proteobacteria bacterium]|nr:MAG: energy transducer TonB [Pseudomonadota bacterium]
MGDIHTSGFFSRFALLTVLAPSAAGAVGEFSDATSSSNVTALFLQQIAVIETAHGALDHRLSEHFLGLGLAHRANGDAENAAAAFRQALHINRINKGLHNLVHVPIVDLLIESSARLGDWHAVEQQHRYRYWIHRREVAMSSDEFIDAAVVFAAWETRAYKLDTGVAAYLQLRDAQDALASALQTIVSDRPSDDPRLINILHTQALVNLNLALHMMASTEDPATGGATIGDDFGDMIQRRSIIAESFKRGKGALQHVVNLTDSEALRVQHGLALANLADWQLIFDRPQASAKFYRRAYDALNSAGLSAEEIAVEFGDPQPMSKFTIERRQTGEPPRRGSGEVYVVATFDVNRRGNVWNIEIVDAYPADNRKIIRRARKTLRATRFRPSISHDGPVNSSGTIRYDYPDDSI